MLITLASTPAAADRGEFNRASKACTPLWQIGRLRFANPRQALVTPYHWARLSA